MPRRFVYFGISLGIVVLDQLTKAVVAARIPLHETIPVIRGFFDLTHVRNTGTAFGLFSSIDSPWRTAVLTGVAVVVFLGVLAWALTSPPDLIRLQVALAFVLGGAIGNLIDRVRFHSVTDFLRFYVERWEWPSFNVADSAISVGVVLLAWDIWRPAEKEPETCTQS